MENLEIQIYAKNPKGIQERLKSAKVAVVGLGGLGSNLAVMLARAGVGQLLLIDYDKVEPSNLNRQHYSTKHIGTPKTKALYEQLSEINPFTTLYTKNVKINDNNVEQLLTGYDVICEALDNPKTKAMLVNTALEKLSAYVVAASGMAGIGSANNIKTTHPMKRLYVCGDMTTDEKEGITAPMANLCAAHQANTVLRILNELYEI